MMKFLVTLSDNKTEIVEADEFTAYSSLSFFRNVCDEKTFLEMLSKLPNGVGVMRQKETVALFLEGTWKSTQVIKS